MTEDYLHYIWKFSKFSGTNLVSQEGETIEIINKGFHNRDSGPDFTDAKIKIGNTTWVGTVEIHLASSHWSSHKHQFDKAYNNVILHVVYEDDAEVLNEKGSTIPTLVLKQRINEESYFEYERFLNQEGRLPCFSRINQVPSIVIADMMNGMLVERMERKFEEIRSQLSSNLGDWEETFHQSLYRYMGMRVNGSPMMDLAQRLPMKLLSKEAHNRTSVEALIFGQAGFLNETQDDTYYSRLRSEYLYLKQKYGLASMDAVQWKFSKMRPANFPTIRMAQLASIHICTQHLFTLVRDKLPIKDLHSVFSIETSEYWQSHYSFQSNGSERFNGRLGRTAIENLIINLVAPFTFAYGRFTGDDSYEKHAFSLLDQVPAERNKMTKTFQEMDVQAETARDSQAQIQLFDKYCSKKRCLNCKIGVFLLQ